MLINSPDCSSCLFSWYGLQIMVGCDLSQTGTKPKLELTRFEARIFATACFRGLLPFRVKLVETCVIGR